jgi:hypothetical protein
MHPWPEGAALVEISDDYIRQRLTKARGYVTVFLRKGPGYRPPASRPPEQARIVWEHVRRNMRLQAEGKKALVGPVEGGGEIVGLAVFLVPEAEARQLMENDPAVREGIFVYDVVTWHEFPGDGLPAA